MLRRAYMRGNSAAIRSTNESDSASCILELHVRPGSESANYDRPRRFLYLVDSHTRTAALIGIRKNRQRFSQPEESSAPARRTCERTIHLAVLLRPLRHHLFLLLLRELQMLLAEEPEPRSLRAVLAAWKAAAHVSFQSTSATATRSSAVSLNSSSSLMVPRPRSLHLLGYRSHVFS